MAALDIKRKVVNSELFMRIEWLKILLYRLDVVPADPSPVLCINENRSHISLSRYEGSL